MNKAFLNIAISIFFFLFLILGGWSYDYFIGMKSGYRYNDTVLERSHISKGEQIVVGPTIVDAKTYRKYIVGVGFSSKKINCLHENFERFHVSDEVFYFLLNTKNGYLEKLYDINRFQKKLKSNKIKYEFAKNKLSLYREKYFSYYRDFDLTDCY